MTEDDIRITEASNGVAQEEDEEDDYMNMIIAEPTKPREKETYTQRRQRIQRESEARSRTKSKAEIAAEEAAAREEALSKSMLAAPESANSKGLKMMAKMGFKPGVPLGAKDNVGARLEPVVVSIKEGKGGIGLEEEKKRKFREEVERDGKRVKAEEGIRKREEKERDRRMRYDLQQSLSRLPTYDDADEDKDDKRALGKDKIQHTIVEDLEEEDPELDAFNLLEPAERLRKLVEHLRDRSTIIASSANSSILTT
ncbi:hypothetical protein DID88_003847 [Monilinia fructigena]|uniref:G-patch domain-containing protein n=1 Tax=Monilinia fructigena TaxID=38457 RepID=A0A395ITR6_9HELO|nr:hypothetical protein DID88_003847 [Monilinia fructigena]